MYDHLYNDSGNGSSNVNDISISQYVDKPEIKFA